MRPPIINRDSPRIQVSMDWGSSRPAGLIALYMRRVGEPVEFAVYPPIEENGGNLTFQFDELLFVRPQGRYEGRMLVGATEYAMVPVEYKDTVTVLTVENSDDV